MNTRMHAIRTLAGVAISALLLSAPAAFAQGGKEPTPTPREGETGNSVSPRPANEPAGRVIPGDRAPDFELDGSKGQPVKLSSLRGDWIVLVFADRFTTVTPLKSTNDNLRLLGARVVAVCHESAQHVESQARRDTLNFLVFADPLGEVAGAYGLYDAGHAQTLPGFLVLDRRGIVKLELLGESLPPDQVEQLVRFAITGS